MINFLKKYMDIFIIIFVHIAISFLYFVLFLSLLFVSLFLLWVITCSWDNFWGDVLLAFCFCICSGFILLVISPKFLILPVLYKKLKKNTKCEILKTFIYNLRYSIKTRIITIISILPISLIGSLSKGGEITFDRIVSYIIILIFTTDLCSCYAVLFLWWKYHKEIKKTFLTMKICL